MITIAATTRTTSEEPISTDRSWSPSSWRKLPIKQQASYPDVKALQIVLDKISTMPPLVSVQDIESCRHQLSEVVDGKRFLLQGGDCAETFADCHPELIEKKLRIMLQMSLVLVWGARMPTLRVSRMAGQYAKPRSKDVEMINGKQVFVFRGENVNGFDPSERTPDPARLEAGYFHAAATLNYARVLLTDGFGDIHDAGKWDLGFVSSSARKEEYQDMVRHISASLQFVHTCGVGYAETSLATVDLFVSHEGLGLAYEEAMTRQASNGLFYNLGTNFLWIGDRTRDLEGAHVEYFRGIANPIGIKVGPSMAPSDLVPLIRRLWPSPTTTPGKITLITRYGYEKVKTLLPAHIEAVQKAGLPVVWSCDPCHGNTTTATNGYKTRHFDHILSEIKSCLEIHKRMDSILGGVHIELTGENVTECMGGPEDLLEGDLPVAYTTYCDPRLNYCQSMEVAFLLAKELGKEV